MVLVTGGVASGKRSYVESLGFKTASIDEGTLGCAPVLYGLEKLLRQGPLSREDFEVLCSKEVVVVAEVGSGVVPLDADERAWRELVGRTTNQLSGQARSVVRMVCGIPLILK